MLAPSASPLLSRTSSQKRDLTELSSRSGNSILVASAQKRCCGPTHDPAKIADGQERVGSKSQGDPEAEIPCIEHDLTSSDLSASGSPCSDVIRNGREVVRSKC